MASAPHYCLSVPIVPYVMYRYRYSAAWNWNIPYPSFRLGTRFSFFCTPTSLDTKREVGTKRRRCGGCGWCSTAGEPPTVSWNFSTSWRRVWWVPCPLAPSSSWWPPGRSGGCSWRLPRLTLTTWNRLCGLCWHGWCRRGWCGCEGWPRAWPGTCWSCPTSPTRACWQEVSRNSWRRGEGQRIPWTNISKMFIVLDFFPVYGRCRRTDICSSSNQFHQCSFCPSSIIFFWSVFYLSSLSACFLSIHLLSSFFSSTYSVWPSTIRRVASLLENTFLNPDEMFHLFSHLMLAEKNLLKSFKSNSKKCCVKLFKKDKGIQINLLKGQHRPSSFFL